MSRKKLLIGNWKMNHTTAETVDFCNKVKADGLVKLARSKKITIGICPSYISLQTAKKHAHGLLICSQDAHYEESGAFTSSVSVGMLEDININWSLVGHSERRIYNGDNSFVCNRKIRKLLDHNFHVVYCVGESEAEYDKGLTKDIIKEQITTGLMNVTREQMSNIVIAYEPIWSIGTGKNASVEIADDVNTYIRSLICDLFGKIASLKLPILYGGSVKPGNIHEYLSCKNIDGALVGGASLKEEDFKAMLENI